MSHKPVLLKEIINSLHIKKNGIYIDATYGCGGHTKEILKNLGPLGKVYAIDYDSQSIDKYKINDQRITYINKQFSNLKKICLKYNVTQKIDGIIFDLGISSYQLYNPMRGFSFMSHGPLDMRINTKQGITAYDLLKKIKLKELSFILKKYGEEKFHNKIAKKIKQYIMFNQLNNTYDLSKLVCSIVKKYNKHPATRTFQAIRIYLNNELKELHKALNNTLDILKIGGILSVISFHSLEDRIVKTFMKKFSSINICNLKIPLNDIELAYFFKNKCQLKIINRIFPTKLEINNNYQARSAILRIAQKI
ncbi:16S rRNA (cytosine(1402)-N(4))-methyltransferase RsmH [Enterobacteriaceae endosymbiont of Macroplea appendiculata]|uniref:16S rRNA (cytosine(1402)-N(4))-methyltransferase RsmH n=1 Tax=Enterobacteriaceae endosymbiont of Macroplea appendiculata TaxID=2675790 RepID=UPI001448EDEE|nr:16S rRNA (cytosine(1402)-N(4))-methyltransferase RsmH [Enterobacteriaceae endosymbiont of Macroplea appendiculata]QJC30762.1 16S rRNA (cytosine(1402)-N(4))-methyltransferase RsmH [Enterobacteriaceae endosymbiont of Macroplea appendiculata]